MGSGRERYAWAVRGWTRHPVVPLVVGVLLTAVSAACVVEAVGAHARGAALDRGDVERVVGELEGRSYGRQSDPDGDWRIRTDAGRTVTAQMGARADRRLDDHRGEQVTALLDDGRVAGIEVPGGEVVRAQTVGRDGVVVFTAFAAMLLAAGVVCLGWGAGRAVAGGGLVRAGRARMPRWARVVVGAGAAVLVPAVLVCSYLVVVG